MRQNDIAFLRNDMSNQVIIMRFGDHHIHHLARLRNAIIDQDDTIEDRYVVGYGMDPEEVGRNYAAIYYFRQ